jgi:hypothetical protein
MEKQVLDSIFFDGEGRKESTLYIDAVAYVGHQYEGKNGLYVGDKKGERFPGVTDTKGNYFYARYNGNTEVGDKTATVPLFGLLVLNRYPTDPKLVALAVAKLLGSSKNILKPVAILENGQDLFQQETALDADRLTKGMVLYGFEFTCIYTLPNSCSLSAFQDTLPNCC